jgi:hypothetical protein
VVGVISDDGCMGPELPTGMRVFSTRGVVLLVMLEPLVFFSMESEAMNLSVGVLVVGSCAIVGPGVTGSCAVVVPPGPPGVV